MTTLHDTAMVGAGFKPAPTWDSRIDRCNMLTQRYPSAREILNFYQKILTFQKILYEELKGIFTKEEGTLCNLPLKKGLEKLFPLSPSLLSVVREGTPFLAAMTKEVSSWGLMGWEALLEDFQLATHREQPLFFFPKVLLQPYLQYVLEVKKDCESSPENLNQKESSEQWQGKSQKIETACPFCGHRPQVGYLRPGDNASHRFLVCSFCHGEWPYKRLSCPGCAESNKKKLSYYVVEEYPAIRVDVCDACKQYIKTIDLGKDHEAIPLVDELASVPLDLWAREKGYEKTELNLAGI